MNLEMVEEKCIEFLQQSANPLVPLSTLLRYLWQDDEFGLLSENDLLDFLRNHELFYVIDLEPPEKETEDELKEAGIPTGPRVMLKSRMPTKAEMATMMRQQMETMINALESALQEARAEEDFESQGEVSEIINRAEKLRQELEKLLE